MLEVKAMVKYVPTDAHGIAKIQFNANPNAWEWPVIDNTHQIDIKDIITKIKTPKLLSSRTNEHYVEKIQKYWTLKRK